MEIFERLSENVTMMALIDKSQDTKDSLTEPS